MAEPSGRVQTIAHGNRKASVCNSDAELKFGRGAIQLSVEHQTPIGLFSK